MGPQDGTGHECYLQCVECLAVYAVEPEELEGSPRMVGCCACLHEWYASESDLLCGTAEAQAALDGVGSFEERSRREKEVAGRKAVLAARVEGAAGDEAERFNVFVGNLSFRATEEDLYRAFSGYGMVVKCQVPSDGTGASKGYGFVEMGSRESGIRAIESLQGTSILGRDVCLNEARPKRELSLIHI